MAQGASGAILQTRAVRMRGVFDHDQFMFFGNGHDGVHVRNLAGEVNGNDRPRAWSDRSFDCFWIKVESIQIDIRKNGNGIGFDDGGRGRNECVRRDDDFVVRLDARREQADAQGNGAIRDGDGVFAIVHRRKTIFEFRNLPAVESAPLAAAQRF